MKKKFINMLILLFSAAALMLLFSACTPTKYDDEEVKKITEEGTAILEKYLDSLNDDRITDRKYEMEIGADGGYVYAGYYLSHVVRATFTVDGEEYRAYVNLEDGQIYTDYRTFDIFEQLKRQLKPYCEKYGFSGDFKVTGGYGGAEIEFYLTSHDVAVKNGESRDVLVDMVNVIPAEFCGEDPDAVADAYLKNVPLTEFDIEYEPEDDDSFLDPRILLDYLAESGNYVQPDDIRLPDAIHEYNINGRPAKENAGTGDRVDLWNATVIIKEGLEQATIDLRRFDIVTENNMELRYCAKGKSTGADDFNAVEFSQYECPLEITDGKIDFTDTASGVLPRLRFTEDPGYAEIERVRYQDGKAQEAEKMVMTKTEDGYYVPVVENGAKNITGWYLFESEQELTFK